MTMVHRVMTVGLALLLPACSAVDPAAGFGDVRSTIASRTGMTVQWNTDSPDDARVSEAARRLLEHGLDADAAVQIALLNNRELQAQFERLGVAQADLVQAGLLANPVFTGNAKLFHKAPEIEFDVARSFLDLFWVPLRKNLAEAEFDAAKAIVAGRVIDLAQEVRRAVVRVQAETQTLELRRGVVEAMAASSELMRRLHEAGNVTDLRFAAERAGLCDATLDLASAELDVSGAREHLTRLMGLFGNDTAWTLLGRMPDLPAEPDDLADVETRAVKASLDLEANRRLIDAAAQAAGLADWSALFPEAEVGVAVKKETDGSWGVGPSLTLPIPLFDQGQARNAVAASVLRSRLHDHVSIAVGLRSAARVAADRVVGLRARTRYVREVLLPLRVQIVKETQLQFNGMLVGAFELFLTKRQEIETGVQYIAALRDYWLARADLQQILMGRIVESCDASSSAHGSMRATKFGDT